MSEALGRAGFKEIALATAFGAASSSCSYAAVAAAKSMFKRGAHLVPSLAFMFASTNLVIELGLVLWQLMGWQFTLAEWLGGIFLVAIMSLLVKLTYPAKIVEEGRNFEQTAKVAEHDHGAMLAPGRTLWDKLRSRQGWIYVAHYVSIDWSMIWKDLVAGFIIAGFLAVLVPNSFWNSLFLQAGPAPLRVIENAIIGPIIAVISFVCSIRERPTGGYPFRGWDYLRRRNCFPVWRPDCAAHPGHLSQILRLAPGCVHYRRNLLNHGANSHHHRPGLLWPGPVVPIYPLHSYG